MGKKLISFCIPCFNEEGNIIEFYKRLSKELESLKHKYNFEIIFEDNASTDNTFKLLQELAQKDRNVKVILNKRNFGPMRNGAYIMFQAHGDAVIGYPCDLQVPLDLIKKYIFYWENGYEVVIGQIATSKEKKIMFNIRTLYYSIMDYFSDVKQLYHVTGTGLYDKKALQLIYDLDEPEPDFRFLITELGLKYKLIQYEQPCRKAGKSSYSIKSYYNQAVDSFVEVSRKPIRYITNFGVFLTCFTSIFNICLVLFKIKHRNTFSIFKLLPFSILSFILSIQVFCMGLLGEYINVLLKRNVKRPMIIERERINF